MVCGSAHTHTHTVQPRSSRRMGRGRGWSYQVPGEARQPRPREPWTARPPPVCLSRSLSPGRPPWVATSGLGGRRWTPWCACVRWSYAAPANDTRAQSARLPLHSTAVARFHPGGGSSSECCATRRVPSSATSPTTTAPIKTVLYTCATVGGLLYPLPLACTHDMHPHRWRCHSVQAPRTHVRRLCDGMLASEGTRPPRGAENGGLIVVVALTMRPRVCCLLTYPRVCACAVSRAGGRSHLSEETGKPPLLRLKTVSRETSLTVSVLRCSGLPSRCDPPSARVFHTVPLVSTHPPPIVVSSHPPSSREEGEARLRVGDVRRRRLVIKRYPPSTIHTCPCVCIRSACSDVVVRLRSRRMDGCGMWPTPTPSLPPWKSVPVKASPSAGGGDALSVCHTLSRPSRRG